MNILKPIIKEINTVTRVAAYFAIVFLMMMTMKKLYLKDYNIEFYGISKALVGALILSKVVILMEFISLGPSVQRQPAIVDIILRTLLYTAGVLLVLILESAFEKRHEAGSFGQAIPYVLSHRDIYHVWATILGSAYALFVYNAFSVLQRFMGKKGVTKLFFITPLNQVENSKPIEKTLSVGN
jgi:hypothetical protein